VQEHKGIGFAGIELAFTLPLGRPLRGRVEVFLDAPPTHPEAPFDLPNRQMLAAVEAMQVIDLRREHYALSVIARAACWPGRCSLQDRAPSDLERAAVGDSARQRPDVDHHATSSPGSTVVISADSRGTRPGTPGLQHFQAVIRVAAAALAAWAAALRLPGR
jgi:hypothetical protein